MRVDTAAVQEATVPLGEIENRYRYFRGGEFDLADDPAELREQVEERYLATTYDHDDEDVYRGPVVDARATAEAIVAVWVGP